MYIILVNFLVIFAIHSWLFAQTQSYQIETHLLVFMLQSRINSRIRP